MEFSEWTKCIQLLYKLTATIQHFYFNSIIYLTSTSTQNMNSMNFRKEISQYKYGINEPHSGLLAKRLCFHYFSLLNSTEKKITFQLHFWIDAKSILNDA